MVTKIKTSNIADNAISADQIAVGAITVADIPDGEITAAKLHTTAITDKLGYTPVNPVNIKTINGTSLLGSGDITISSGSSAYADLTGTPTIPVDVSDLTDTTNLLIHFSGAYADLTGKPTIPVDVSDLTDTTNLLVHFDGAFSSLTGAPTIPADVSDLTDTTNLLVHFDGAFSSLTGTPTTLSGYGITNAQDELISGTNIKTINGTSILGSGDITISGGGGGSLTVSEINGLTTSNEVTSVTALRFDNATGFNVTDLGSGEVKVSLGSSFKTLQVAGQSDLVAVGEDTLELVAGTGISITTNTGSTPKALTIASTFSSYSDSDVDTHLNTSSATSNYVLSWNGSDYVWVSQSGGGGSTAWGDITGTPTTLSGYGITDAHPTLISGTNIKTINGTSLLGSGNITISGGSGGSVEGPFDSIELQPTTLPLATVTGFATIPGSTTISTFDDTYFQSNNITGFNVGYWQDWIQEIDITINFMNYTDKEAWEASNDFTPGKEISFQFNHWGGTATISGIIDEQSTGDGYWDQYSLYLTNVVNIENIMFLNYDTAWWGGGDTIIDITLPSVTPDTYQINLDSTAIDISTTSSIYRNDISQFPGIPAWGYSDFNAFFNLYNTSLPFIQVNGGSLYFNPNGELSAEGITAFYELFPIGETFNAVYNSMLWNITVTQHGSNEWFDLNIYYTVNSYTDDYDLNQNNNINSWGSTGAWTIEVSSIVKIKNYFTSATINGNSYTRTTTSWETDGFSVGDVLTYAPGTTSISFVNSEPLLTKQILYDNITGDMSYGGLITEFKSDTFNNNLVSTNFNSQSSIDSLNNDPQTSTYNNIFITNNNQLIAGSTSNTIIGVNIQEFQTFLTSNTLIGANANSNDSDNATVVGAGATVNGWFAQAFGSSATALGDYTLSIGSLAKQHAKYSASINYSYFGYAPHIRSCWGPYTFTANQGTFYIGIVSGTTTSPTASSTYAKDLNQLMVGSYIESLSYAKVRFLMRFKSDTYSPDDWKIVEKTYAINTTGYYTYALYELSSNVVGDGGGSQTAGWTPSLYIYGSRYISCEFINTNASVSGQKFLISADLEIQTNKVRAN